MIAVERPAVILQAAGLSCQRIDLQRQAPELRWLHFHGHIDVDKSQSFCILALGVAQEDLLIRSR
jgi:hypothetical protein